MNRWVFNSALCLCLLAPVFPVSSEIKPNDKAVAVENVFSIDEYKGKVVYLDFWASWCTPCALSFPWMQSLSEKHSEKGLVVLAVNLDQHKSDADRFLKKMGPTFSVVFDPEGKSPEIYGVPGMPTSYLIDRKGIVRQKHVGFHKNQAKAYEEEILSLLAESPPK